MKPEENCQTPRHADLERLTRYFESTQYDGRPDWWTGRKGDREVVPLRERKPCIIYPLPKAACQQLTRFTFGVERWPALRVDDERLGEGAHEDATTALTKLVDHAAIKPAIRTLMESGLARKTGVAVISLRRGRVVIDTPRPQDCIPTFEDDDPSGAVLEMVWVYQFDKTVGGPNGPETKRHWYRRDITATSVIQYRDAEVIPNKPPAWSVLTETAHGFGFCPILWMRNMPGCQHGDIDGTSLTADYLDEFDALNFSLSQRHRGIHYFGTPQAYETGVAADDGPEADGRTARSDGPPGFSSAHVPAGRAPHGQTVARARRMAPDNLWSYRGENVKVDILETTGKAFEVASMHVDDIRSRILESMGVVLIHPNMLMGAGGAGGREMSGRFLRLACGPMLNLVDELRESCWWPHLQDLIRMVLRVIGSQPAAGLRLPDVEGLQALAELAADDHPLSFSALWGDAFELSPEETKASAEAAGAAVEKGLIAKETASRYVAGPFGVLDVAAEREAIEEEAEEAAEKAMAATEALMAAHGPEAQGPDGKPQGGPPGADDGPPRPGAAKPPKTPPAKPGKAKEPTK